MTLVEMALVLLILGVLTRAAITPLTAAQEHRHFRAAQTQLESVKSSLWAYVVANGALPCPVLLGQSGSGGGNLSGFSLTQISTPSYSEPMGQRVCNVHQGGVPARELGLAGAIDSQGALLDPWNSPYQLAVSLVSHQGRGVLQLPDWTSPGETSRIGIAQLTADLVLCSRAVGNHCPAAEVRASELSFVLFSTGADSSLAGDQRENQDADSIFVLQPPSVQPEHPFDDQMLWGTAAETTYWMLRAGWLP